MNRVRVAKDKAELVRSLASDTPSATGTVAPFSTYADLLAFAAALGVKRRQRSPLGDISREPTPIAVDIFVSRGYDRLFKLIAVLETRESAVLSSTDPEADARRVALFEEYANGGLDILQGELRGAIDYTEALLLLLMHERNPEERDPQGFDLRRFL